MTRAVLIRVGIDQAFGAWNAPMDPNTNEFVYVPIPEQGRCSVQYATPFARVEGALEAFSRSRPEASPTAVRLPRELLRRNMHLDPDFEALTYGDNGLRRGRALSEFSREDVLVFYSGLRPVLPCSHRLVYAIIGLYRVAEVVSVRDVPPARWRENAHTRRLKRVPDDVVVRAAPGSGRLRRCLPIGEWRDGSYRVRRELLEAWGDLSCRDGFIQRSAVPPLLRDPLRFQRWFGKQDVELIAVNNAP